MSCLPRQRCVRRNSALTTFSQGLIVTIITDCGNGYVFSLQLIKRGEAPHRRKSKCSSRIQFRSLVQSSQKGWKFQFDLIFSPLGLANWRLASVPSTSTQAKRVFIWLGFLLNKRRLSLSRERVSFSRTLSCDPLIVKLYWQ